jgi:hypothetical protein
MTELVQKYIDLEKNFSEHLVWSRKKFKELEEEIERLNTIIALNSQYSQNSQNSQNTLDIIIEKYKKSIVVKNKSSINTTIAFKDVLKELGGKWTKSDSLTGWIFVGSYKNEDKSLEENAQFIVKFIK